MQSRSGREVWSAQNDLAVRVQRQSSGNRARGTVILLIDSNLFIKGQVLKDSYGDDKLV